MCLLLGGSAQKKSTAGVLRISFWDNLKKEIHVKGFQTTNVLLWGLSNQVSEWLGCRQLFDEGIF